VTRNVSLSPIAVRYLLQSLGDDPRRLQIMPSDTWGPRAYEVLPRHAVRAVRGMWLLLQVSPPVPQWHSPAMCELVQLDAARGRAAQLVHHVCKHSHVAYACLCDNQAAAQCSRGTWRVLQCAPLAWTHTPGSPAAV
jgi:hypothetical protein